MATTDTLVNRYNLTKVTCINGYKLATGKRLTTKSGLGWILNRIVEAGGSLTKNEIYSGNSYYRFVKRLKVIEGYSSSIFSFARANGLLDYNNVNHRWTVTEKGKMLLNDIVNS